MDKVVHFEIPVDNIKRAEKFYEVVFGWSINPAPEMNYTILRTVDIDENYMPKETGAINGGMMKRKDPIKTPVITINVDDIDASLKKIEKNGGKVAMKKFQVGDMGYAAYFQDTEGNVLGVWQNIK